MFTSTVFASILPEILILILGILVLVVEPFWKEEQRRNVGWLTAGGLLLAMVISLLFGQPGEPTTTLGGMVRFDWLGFFFKMLFMFAGAATALLLMDNEKVGQRGEAYLLLLASLIGMNLMAIFRGSGHALPGDRDHLHSALCAFGLHAGGREIDRSRFQVSALRRADLDDHALWFQPALRFYRDDKHLSTGRYAPDWQSVSCRCFWRTGS